jgi:uncharacterized membrane protein (Fun14 family)
MGAVASNLPLEDFVFSAGGGFLFGTAAGYSIKKVMKIVAIIIGLFVAALAYLSYKGLIDVKWVAMENITRGALVNASGQVVHALNNTATQFAGCRNIRATDSSCGWIYSRNDDGVQEGLKMNKIDFMLGSKYASPWMKEMICMTGALVFIVTKSVLTNRGIVNGIMTWSIDVNCNYITVVRTRK